MNQKKRRWKRCIAALLFVTMLLPMVSNLNLYADSVVDRFYVLDEEGNPVMIEITQSDLDIYQKPEKEENADDDQTNYYNSGIMAVDEAEDPDETDETDNSDATEEVIGIVRFNRSKSTLNVEHVDTGRSNYISPLTTAEAAYLGRQDDKVICYVAGSKFLVDAADCEEPVSYQDQSICYYYVGDTYLIHKYTYYKDANTLTTSDTRVGLPPSYLKKNVNYYSYDGHYFYESFEDMIEDYKNDVRTQSVNPNEPFYNYYQYISLNTTNAYTAEEYNAYIEEKAGADSGSAMLNTGADFVNAQNTYTKNSILMLGIAINESGWGKSTIAKEKNNLFGLNAVDGNADEAADAFESVAQCIEEFAYYHLQCKYLKGSDSRYRGPHLGDKQSGINVSYASDPYWGEKAASRPYYFDTENKDYGRYSLGIAKAGKIELYKEADAESTCIYTSDTSNGGLIYQYPVTILDKVKGSDGAEYYQIISDMALKEDRSARDVEAIYNPDRDYVYAKASDIQVVFNGSGEITLPEKVELPFTDVSETAWYRENVEYVYKNELMTGKTDTLFAPNDVLLRSEFCTILYRAEGEPNVTYTDIFSDVPANTWYTEGVMWAYENGIVNGYENGKFGTSDYITREQMAVMMERYGKYKGYNMADGADLTSFEDYTKISSYAKDAMAWAVAEEIIRGKEEGVLLDPQGNALRAECAAIIQRFCVKYNH